MKNIFEVTVKVKKEVRYLEAIVGVDHWDESMVNGKQDDQDDPLMPLNIDCNVWIIMIDLETGQIENWPVGTTANINYKVRDDGVYTLYDENRNDVLKQFERYVPSCLCPKANGYGDYVIMDIDEQGYIKDFSFNAEDFEEYEE